MPNWVTQRLVITGDKEAIASVKAQLSKPYTSHHWEHETNSIGHRVIEGDFLLWNIIQPTNLEVYYEYAKFIEKAEAKKAQPDEDTKQTSPEDVVGMLQERINSITPEDFSNFAQQFQEDVSIGQDWYHWNIRNWGTKWELNGSFMEKDTETELIYCFDTAWSPIVPALDELSACYPSLVMTLRFIDEGDGFAGEAHWANRKRVYETDLNINHGLKEEMYGECWICSGGNENDPELEEYRKELRCAEFTAKLEIEGVL